MSAVDLNYKIWDMKAKTHFYIQAGSFIALSMTLFVSLFDFANLPRDVSKEVKMALLTQFLVYIPIYCVIGGVYLLLLLCPNQIWYGICMAMMILHVFRKLLFTTITLIAFGITQTNDEKKLEVLKYYTLGLFANILIDYGAVLIGLYASWIFFELSFLYNPKKLSDLYVVRVVSPNVEQGTDIAIDTKGNSYISRARSSTDLTLETQEESDPANENGVEKDQSPKAPVDQEKPKSAKSRKSQKSGKSQKTQGSEKSKEGGKSVESPPNEKLKSSKSSKSGTPEKLNNSLKSFKFISM